MESSILLTNMEPQFYEKVMESYDQKHSCQEHKEDPTIAFANSLHDSLCVAVTFGSHTLC